VLPCSRDAVDYKPTCSSYVDEGGTCVFASLRSIQRLFAAAVADACQVRCWLSLKFALSSHAVLDPTVIISSSVHAVGGAVTQARPVSH